jgi:hypothetical protein
MGVCGSRGSHSTNQPDGRPHIGVAGVDRDGNHRPDGNDNGPLDPDVTRVCGRSGKIFRSKRRKTRVITKPVQAGSDSRALQNEFEFSGNGGGKIGALLFQEATQSRDEQFAAEHQHSHPGGEAGIRVSGQENVRAANNYFVDEGIEHAAEDGDLAVAAGPKPIEPIGAGGDDEEPKASPIPVQVQKGKQDNRERQANGCYLVGKVYDGPFVIFCGSGRRWAGDRHGSQFYAMWEK